MRETFHRKENEANNRVVKGRERLSRERALAFCGLKGKSRRKQNQRRRNVPGGGTCQKQLDGPRSQAVSGIIPVETL